MAGGYEMGHCVSHETTTPRSKADAVDLKYHLSAI